MRRIIKRILKHFGYELRKSDLRNDHFKRRMALINYFGINKIFDVGANTGQYGKILRSIGYRGKIISFEPVNDTYIKLTENIKNDKNWTAERYALGHFDGTALINISANSVSSSILDMLPSHLQHRPESGFVNKEFIKVYKLNTVAGGMINTGDIIMLKIDAQGYEYNILEGASDIFHDIKGIQIEMSLEPQYAEEKNMCEIIDYLFKKGFKLMSIEPGSVNYMTGQMFQIDGIFIKI